MVPIDPLSAEARDLVAISRVYRMSLQAAAIDHAARRHSDMACLLAAGAEAAGEVALEYEAWIALLAASGARA
jgi:hypothetical protein